MIAYFVHNKKNNEDTIVLPEAKCSVLVTPERFEKFISVKPEFNQWIGDICTDLVPENAGIVVASRQENGDVCILHDDLWRERMFFYMSGGKK